MHQIKKFAVIQQQTEKGWQPLAFMSKKFSNAQSKYSPFDRELLAIYSSKTFSASPRRMNICNLYRSQTAYRAAYLCFQTRSFEKFPPTN